MAVSILLNKTGLSDRRVTGAVFGFGIKGDNVPSPLLTLDVSISENYEYQSKITDMPIEDGSEITDNVIHSPNRLDLEGFVSNSPIKWFGDITQGAVSGGVDSFTSMYDNSTNKVIGYDQNRVVSAFNVIENLYYSNIPFDVLTGLKLYKNMLFESINIPRDRRTGDTFRFTAKLKEIKTVSIQQIDINVNDDKSEGVSDRAQSKQDKGNQTTKEATTEEENSVSLLQNAVYKVQGYLQ